MPQVRNEARYFERQLTLTQTILLHDRLKKPTDQKQTYRDLGCHQGRDADKFSSHARVPFVLTRYRASLRRI
jgi:hypothetical protein